MSDLATGAPPPASTATAAATTAAGGRAVRGRYAKFNGGMDVLLLEAIVENNPFTAKHGTRLQMWQSVAEIVGEELFKNPDAYSWHTCRDRVTALLKMYADGKHEKLFRQGTAEENARKEAILSALSLSIARKNKIGAPHAAVAADNTAMLDTADIAAARAPTPVVDAVRQVSKPESPPVEAIEASLAPPAATTAVGAPSAMADLKRRRLDVAGSSAAAAAASPFAESNAALNQQQQQPVQLMLPDTLGTSGALNVSAPTSNGAAVPATAAPAAAAADAHLSSSAFRARVLHLIESKVQFDMDQRTRETELREQEFELQKRFLEYLQSK